MSDSSAVHSTSTGGDGTSPVSMNGMSPYYIHPSDNPCQLHVIDRLSEVNYGEWVNDMSTVLYAKNKFGFVDGTIAKPSATSNDLPYWVRADAMVRGWLKTAMEKDVRSSVRSARTAYEIWADIAERFGKGSAPRAYELRRAITSLRQEKLTVSAYYTKLKSLWDEVSDISPLPNCSCNGCTCGLRKQVIDMREKEHLYDFLMGLDDSFATIKTQILSTQPIPSIGIAYHLVSEDEQQRNIAASRRPIMESVAFQTQAPHPSQVRTQEALKGDVRGNINRPRCTHCGKTGHYKATCFEIIGYPQGWRKPNRPGAGHDSGSTQRNFNPRPKAAHVSHDDGSGSSLTQEQINTLLRHLARKTETDHTTTNLPSDPSVNMAGLNFEEPDWNG